MRYYILNNETKVIENVILTLSELRVKYPNIDISDYIDDLEQVTEGTNIVTEDYINNSLENSVKQSKTDGSDVASLQVEIDGLNKLKKELTNEIGEVHSELKTLSDKNRDKESEIKRLESVEKGLNENITVLKTQQQTLSNAITVLESIQASSYVEELTKNVGNMQEKITKIQNLV